MHHSSVLLSCGLVGSTAAEFAVVGGIALHANGYLRATNDLDGFIRPTEENARAAFAALRQLGAPLEGLEPNDLLDDKANDVEELQRIPDGKR